jgi:hypothetical protein
LCDEDEEGTCISSMVNGVDIDSGDVMDLKIERESASEESSDEKSESESETCSSSVDGWKEVTSGDRKPKAYTFTKNAGPQLNLLPDAEPMEYFSLFFNDEILNNVTETSSRETKLRNFS